MNYSNRAPPSARRTSRAVFSEKNSYSYAERNLAFPSHLAVPTIPHSPPSQTRLGRSAQIVSALTIAQNFASHREEAWPGKQLTKHALLKGLQQANRSHAATAITPPLRVPILLKRLHPPPRPLKPTTSLPSMARTTCWCLTTPLRTQPQVELKLSSRPRRTKRNTSPSHWQITTRRST